MKIAENIKETVRNYISESIKTGHQGYTISDNTSLISGGFIDSISTLQLVDFLEKTFQIEFEAHEVDRDNLDTLNQIEEFVQSKVANG